MYLSTFNWKDHKMSMKFLLRMNYKLIKVDETFLVSLVAVDETQTGRKQAEHQYRIFHDKEMLTVLLQNMFYSVDAAQHLRLSTTNKLQRVSVE